MAQKQTKRAEQGKEPLVCTYGSCKKLQSEDGEYCKKHSKSYIKEPSKEYEEVMNALNYIDEIASKSLENTDNGEVYILQKKYNIVADFINKKAE